MKKTSLALPAILLILSVTTLLQGCFPLIATGAAAGAIMVSDRRTTGAYIDDQAIEMKAASEISASRLATNGHVNIISVNRAVLVTGEVPTEEAKKEAIELIRRVDNVRVVYNELTVGPNSSLASRTKDSKITANVKQRMVGVRGVSSGDIKVVTEAGVVYLMGLVSQNEARIAAGVASSTEDVLKVVKLFEFLSDTESRQVDEQHRKQELEAQQAQNTPQPQS